jgi:hypothetical protein
MKQFLSLKTLVWLAGIAFGFMIVSSFVNEFEDFKMGFYAGSGRYIYEKQLDDTTESENDVDIDKIQVIASDVYFLKLEPKGSVFNFQDSLKNLKTNNNISTRYFRMKAALPVSTVLPQKLKIYDGLNTFLSFLIAAIYIFLFVNVYFLLSFLQRELVFNNKNIVQLRKIGVSLLLIFMLMSVYNYLSFLGNKILFEFEDYNILYDMADTVNLFLGIVILLMAEIINRGLKLKQENELTI